MILQPRLNNDNPNAPTGGSIEDLIAEVKAMEEGTGEAPVNPSQPPAPPATDPNTPPAGQQGVTPPATQAEGQTQVEEWINKLGEASNGKVKSLEDLNELLAKGEQVGTLQERLQELEGTPSTPQFADPIVERVNDMYAKGATKEEIMNFFRLQDLDVNSLPEKDLVFQYRKMQNPGLDDRYVRALMDADFKGLEADPDDPDSMPDTVIQAKFAQEVIKAKAALEDAKVQSSTPESVRNATRMEAERAQKTEHWSQLINTLIKQQSAMKFNIQDEAAKLNHSFNYNVPGEADAMLAQQAVNYMVNNNIPLTKEGLQQASDFIKRSRFFSYGEQITESAFRDGFVKGQKAAEQSASGLEGMGTGNIEQPHSQQRESAPVPGQPMSFEDIRKAGI